MAVNPVLIHVANHDEVVVDDALARLYDSQMARMRRVTGARPAERAAPQGVDHGGARR